MSDKFNISVVIPCYNAEKFLEKTLESSLDQSLPPHEILIVNDNSTDDTAAIAEKYQRKYHQIKYIEHQKHEGINESFNKGVSFASGEAIVLRTPEEHDLPNFYHTAATLLKKNPEAAFCCGDVSYKTNATDNYKVETLNLSSHPVFLSPNELADSLSSTFICPTATMIRRNAFIQAGGLNPKLNEYANWFCHLIMAFQQGICYIPESVIGSPLNKNSDYFTQKESSSNLKSTLKNVLKELLFYRRELIPFFVKSSILNSLGKDLLDIVFENEMFWGSEVNLLLYKSIQQWNFEKENQAANSGFSNIIKNGLSQKKHWIRSLKETKLHFNTLLISDFQYTSGFLHHWNDLDLPPIHAMMNTQDVLNSDISKKFTKNEFNLIAIASRNSEELLQEYCNNLFPKVPQLTFWNISEKQNSIVEAPTPQQSLAFDFL